MNHKLFTTLSGLSISGVVLVASLITAGQPTRTPDSLDPAAVAIDRLEAGTVEASKEVAPAPRKHHRGRGSLAMPYFSFAQSLRPRS